MQLQKRTNVRFWCHITLTYGICESIMTLTTAAKNLFFRRPFMNVIFAKTALYAYPNIMAITEQIDELVEKKALCSMNDFSPALEQFNKIADLTEQKKVMFALKLHLDDVIAKLTKEEIDCLEYKYFKRKNKKYFENFDFSSRSYFRRQVKLINKISKALEFAGATDAWFIKNCMCIDFFKELLKRVVELEKNSKKNKGGTKAGNKKISEQKRLTA